MKKDVGVRSADADVRALLEAGDPLRAERPLRPSDVERMRQRVLNVAQAVPRVPLLWRRTVAAAAVVALMVIAAAIATRDVTPKGGTTKVAAPAEPVERRQLQFETPGGTRIIWTLDPEFKLEGVAP